ncbi:MAG: exodeoxyribonuclease VII small subunit [Saprospiraceae bacterium]
MAKGKDTYREMTYETAKTSLDKIIREIQQESISIDQLADRIKQAQDLIKYCQAKLRNIELEVTSIIGDEEE